MTHLIHIGYPKTGSTFLQRWFEANPHIAYVKGAFGGYPHIYSVASSATRAAAASAVRVSSFEGLVAPHQSFGQEVMDHANLGAVTFKTAQTQACDALAGLFPNAKILLVTRNVQSLLQSTYAEAVRGGATMSLAQFYAMLAEMARRDDSPFDFDFVVRLYRERFGAANLLCLPYELLEASPADFVQSIETALALPPFATPASRVNESAPVEELACYLLLNRAAQRMPLPARIRGALFRRYLRAAQSNRLRPAIRLFSKLVPAPFAFEPASYGLVKSLGGGMETLNATPSFSPYIDRYRATE